jgi:lipid A ethanolaminephosphotransferase
VTLKNLLSPSLSAPALGFLCSLYLVLAGNYSFFKAVSAALYTGESVGTSGLLIAWVFSCILLLFFLIFQVIGSLKPVFKPFLILVLVLASVISYFMDNLGIVIDSVMVQNVFETDLDEALELLNARFLLHIFVFGALPGLLVYRTRIVSKPLKAEIINRVLLMGGTALLLGAIVFLNYKTFSFVLRNNHHLRSLVNPTYPVYSLVKYYKASRQGREVVNALGEDAKQNAGWQVRGKKTVVVLVVGETARAENFSLNGYQQDTNPELAKENVINFSNTHSCGTATAVSLPCMFSNLKQSGYSDALAKENENLLDVLKHAGVNVLWLDNNSGCKGVCQRVALKNTETLGLPGYCAEGECYDEIMLGELRAALKALPADTLVVLHQKGSHGPAYYKRHPAHFRKFMPECTRAEVQNCPQDEIRNAYDNTIYYTDHVLAEVVRLLKENNQYNTAMVYMSDHGESLGENGIYLHGLPYALAPEQQTHIPFIMWLSPDFLNSAKVSDACLRQHGQVAYSHDNLFHSVLSMLDVKTRVYEPEYDVFASCQSDSVRVFANAEDKRARN